MPAGTRVFRRPFRKYLLGETDEYKRWDSRRAVSSPQIEEPFAGRIRRTPVQPDPPDPPVAGWVPPKLRVSSPQPEPFRGTIKRSLPPQLHPNFEDFVRFASRLISSPEYEPSRGTVKRARVPHTDEIAIARVFGRRLFDAWVTIPPVDYLNGSVKRHLNPQRLHRRKNFGPPFCSVGQIVSIGATAGMVVSIGAAAGQINCGD